MKRNFLKKVTALALAFGMLACMSACGSSGSPSSATEEKDALQKIMEERNAYQNNKSFELANELNNHFNSLLALQEAYPDLKASEQFLNLQETLEKIESQLQAARRLYNGDVTIYNTKIITFPGNFVAVLMRAKEETLFEIEEHKKENIDVSKI